MLYFTEKKSLCMGCSACAAACPVNCIKMVADEEGFYYPKASDDCINCGKCENICPINNKTSKTTQNSPLKAYGAITKDDAVWRQSASGGAFSEICLTYGDENTIVVGAAWNGLKVEHRCITGVNNIAPLCKSKYIASDMGDVFVTIKESIEAKKKVVFCGTPCQVAGLKSFLGKEYENLLLIDFICHGVGSPSVFKECMNLVGNMLGAPVDSYEFRAKRKVFETNYLAKIKLKEKALYVVGDPYIQLFLDQMCLRPSCGENCKYRDEHRQGDITIADFKGLHTVFPDIVSASKNYSTIVINNSKGMSIVEALGDRMVIKECDLRFIKQFNPLFYKHTYFQEKRQEFFDEFVSNPKEAIEQYTAIQNFKRQSFAKSLLRFLLKSIYFRMKKAIKK